MNDDKHGADALKDLMLEREKSRGPLIVGILLLVGIAGGIGYWMFGPNPGQPTIPEVIQRVKVLADRMLNTPVMRAPVAPAPTESSEDTQLISK